MREDLVNGWWMPSGYDFAKDYRKKPETITTVKLCLSCNQCWQYTINRMGGNVKGNIRGVDYFEDFPTYGLNRTTCRGCKG